MSIYSQLNQNSNLGAQQVKAEMQANSQSAWHISEAPILKIESVKDYLYIFESCKILVYESISNTISLSEQIHLQSPISNCCCSQKYIAIINQTAVEVRIRNHWEKVVYYYMNTDPRRKVRQLSLKDDQVVLQIVDETKNPEKAVLEIHNLSSEKQFQIDMQTSQLIAGFKEHVHLHQDFCKTLDHRLITVDSVGKINDVYVYQTGKGYIQSGIFLQVSADKKKAFKIGELTPLFATGSVKCIYSHRVQIENNSFTPVYVIMIAEKVQTRNIDLFIHELLPFDDGSREKPKWEKSSAQKSNHSLPSTFQEVMREAQTQGSEQQDNDEFAQFENMISQIAKGQTYVNSFYSEGVLWICTDKHDFRVKMRKKVVYGQPLIQAKHHWPRTLPMVGIHLGRPIFRGSVLIRGEVTQSKDGTVRFTLQNDVYVNKLFQESSVSTQRPKSSQQLQELPKKPITDSSPKLLTKKVDSNSQASCEMKSKKVNTFIPTLNDIATQIASPTFSKYTSTNILENTENSTAQTNSLWVQDQQTQTDIYMGAQFSDLQSQTDLTVSKPIQVQANELSGHQDGHYSGNPQQQKVQTVDQKPQKKSESTQCEFRVEQHSVETVTEKSLLDAVQFPSERFMCELIHTVKQFQTSFEECTLSNVEILMRENDTIKGKKEKALNDIACQIRNMGISDEMKGVLLPVIEENMRKIVEQTQKLFTSGLANVRILTEQVSATETTLKKLFKENQLYIQGLRQFIKEMGELTKLKEAYNDVTFEEMREQIIRLRQDIQKLEAKLSARLDEQGEMEEQLLKKFEDLNTLANTLNKMKIQQQQEEEESGYESEPQNESISEESSSESEGKKGKLPSVQGSFINSQSPSVMGYGMPYPHYSYQPMQPQFMQPRSFYPSPYGSQIASFPNYPPQQSLPNYQPLNQFSYPQMSQQLQIPQQPQTQPISVKKKDKKDKKK